MISINKKAPPNARGFVHDRTGLAGASFLDQGEELMEITNFFLERDDLQLLRMAIDVSLAHALGANGGTDIHIAFHPVGALSAAGGRNVMLLLDEYPALDGGFHLACGAQNWCVPQEVKFSDFQFLDSPSRIIELLLDGCEFCLE